MDKLNKNQLEAVNSITGNTLVLAGAGTGKTRVLINRIINLIENGVNPENIFAFTFTNKAANEMKYRIKKVNDKAGKVHISTFHSFCYSHLYDFSEYIGYPKKFNIIDDDDRLKIVKEIIEENNLSILDITVLKTISNIKNHTETEYENINQAVKINFIFHEYQRILLKNYKMDLDDLLYQFQKLMINNPSLKEFLQESAEYILVDECQDTNLIQYEILEMLSKVNNNLFMVGDQDQCIYTFRGSHLANIKTFIDNKNPRIIKLEQNYRSNENILNVANHLIQNNQQRIDKRLYSSGYYKNYQVIYADLDNGFEEATYIAKLITKLTDAGYLYKDIAILYRNHQISNGIEKEMLKNRLPYQLVGGYPFFKHKEIKTIIKYYHFLQNKDDLSLKEIYNIPTRKIGEVTLSKLEREASNKATSIYNQMLLSKNEFIREFVETIKVLEKEFLTEEPSVFIKKLLSIIKYNDYLLKQEKAKIKLTRVYEFMQMFENIPRTDHPNLDSMIFLNQINLDNEKDENHEYVKLMTIHQAKGLEFKVVIIAGLNESVLPSYKSAIKDIEEERRIFYVAITRAKERLYLLSAKERIINGKVQSLKPSSFLNNINIENLHHDGKKILNKTNGG